MYSQKFCYDSSKRTTVTLQKPNFRVVINYLLLLEQSFCQNSKLSAFCNNIITKFVDTIKFLLFLYTQKKYAVGFVWYESGPKSNALITELQNTTRNGTLKEICY